MDVPLRAGMLRLFADAVPHIIWAADAEGTLTFLNRQWTAFTGTENLPSDAAFWAAVHPDDETASRQKWRRCVAAAEPFEDQLRIKYADGGYRWVLARAGPVEETAAVARWVGTLTDIDELKTSERLLREREAEVARVQRIGEVGGLEVDLRDGFHNKRSPEYLRIHGLPSVDWNETHEAWVERIHPDDRIATETHFRLTVKSDATEYAAEYRIIRPSDGKLRWVLAKAEIERDSTGRALRLVGAHIDITQRKLAEQARELLSRELSHRIKNIFSVMNGLVSITARGHPEAKPFVTELRGRLAALDQAHEYVSPSSGEARRQRHETVHGLIRAVLGPYLSAAQARITIEGDDGAMGPHAATALALIVHEQATNAAKYGALSTATGQVEIRTSRTADIYRLVWTESGGPPVLGPPSRQGFGTVMAARSTEQQLEGHITHAWLREGLVVDLSVPVHILSK